MDLSLSDEQKQLQEQAERFVRDKYAFDARRKIAATERGWLPENWQQFAELGWLGMSFSEEDGGYGGGPIETMIVMEQFGKGLVLEPFLPTVVLGGGMIARSGSKAQKEALLAPMIEGKKQFALAWLERQAVVVVDEAYGEFAQAPSAATLLARHANLAVLRTLSKAHALAAARIGSVIADAALIAVLRCCQAPYPIPTPCSALSQSASSALSGRTGTVASSCAAIKNATE